MASEYFWDHSFLRINLFGLLGFVCFVLLRMVVREAKLGQVVQLSACSVQVVQKSLQSRQVWVESSYGLRNWPSLQAVQLPGFVFVQCLHGGLQPTTHFFNQGSTW
jgi:hypothetical protein